MYIHTCIFIQRWTILRFWLHLHRWWKDNSVCAGGSVPGCRCVIGVWSSRPVCHGGRWRWWGGGGCEWSLSVTANCEFECEKVHFEVRDTKKKKQLFLEPWEHLSWAEGERRKKYRNRKRTDNWKTGKQDRSRNKVEGHFKEQRRRTTTPRRTFLIPRWGNLHHCSSKRWKNSTVLVVETLYTHTVIHILQIKTCCMLRFVYIVYRDKWR